MKNVHLLVADLFLPGDFAVEVCSGLRLPFLEKILSRSVATRPAVSGEPEDTARAENSGQSLEASLCSLFGVSHSAGVASISAVFDGLGEGVWLRADPVHVRLQRDQVVLLPKVSLSQDESRHLCVSLNEYFKDQALEFFAPHPERWYVKLNELPDIATVPLSQAAGRNIQDNLPTGGDAMRWRRVFNEIQMLLHAHPLNAAREARGDVPVNSVWLWGGGAGFTRIQGDYASASSDEVLVQMLAFAVGVPFADWSPVWRGDSGLLVWNGLRSALQCGDLVRWRDELQRFETGYAKPLWEAVCDGRIARLTVDIQSADARHRLNLSRGNAWALWRRSRPLADYSLKTR